MTFHGIAESLRGKGDRIVSSPTEHKSVLHTLERLGRGGSGSARVVTTYVPVDAEGFVDPAAIEAAIADRGGSPRTILVSIMAANNEVGTIAPLAEIGRIAKARGVLFHVDAAQALCKIEIDVAAMGIDLLAASAHKFYGPKGIGFLYVRSRDPRVELPPMIEGGGQELGLRSGTLNVPAIVGMGEAVRIGRADLAAESRRIAALRRRLHERLAREAGPVVLNGPAEKRLPGNLNLSFTGISAERLMEEVPEMAVSSGAACKTRVLDPSHVMKAIGAADRAGESIRFGLGRFNTESEIDFVADRIAAAVQRIRGSARSGEKSVNAH